VNWIDLFLLFVIGLSVVGGLMGGFARVGVGFIAAILGIFIAFWCYGIAGAYVLDYVNSRAIANLIGFFVIFFGIVIVGAIVGSILARFFKWVGLSWFDRLLGGAFGAVRGIVVAVALVTVLLAFAPTPPPKSIVDSKLLPYMLGVSNVVAAMTPREIKDAFRDAKENAEKAWAQHRSHPPEAIRRE
jgi:membrane protein required for colicin V production